MRQAWGVQKNEAVESLRVRQAHRRDAADAGGDVRIARRCHSERWIVHERWNVCVHRRRAGSQGDTRGHERAENDAYRCARRVAALRRAKRGNVGKDQLWARGAVRPGRATRVHESVEQTIRRHQKVYRSPRAQSDELRRRRALSALRVAARVPAFERTQAQPHGRRTRMARRRTRGR